MKRYNIAFDDPNPAIEKIRANLKQSTIYKNHIKASKR